MADTSVLADTTKRPGSYANSLAVYMPTGTIAVFGLLSQVILDAGQCARPTPHSGEVAMMGIITTVLGVICFISAFIKIVGRQELDPATGKPTGKVIGIQYKFVTWLEVRGLTYKLDDTGNLIPNKKEEGEDASKGSAGNRYKYQTERRVTWYSGWCLWIHAIVSTVAFLTYALTTSVGSTCFFYLPPPFSKGLPALVALIAAIIFGFLPTPEPGIDLEHLLTVAAEAEVAKGTAATGPPGMSPSVPLNARKKDMESLLTPDKQRTPGRDSALGQPLLQESGGGEIESHPDDK
eukprot:TRINITY_DN15364_c0_g1_i1.p1 TRINITY_DN15364_c0_g1~~TRINITY_DN15364_c0_g1_i1.p1  ORF type:complete len:293 (+),score=45.42 TRINITY_DN15364_c0_g1_i1:641-1519(+)